MPSCSSARGQRPLDDDVRRAEQVGEHVEVARVAEVEGHGTMTVVEAVVEAIGPEAGAVGPSRRLDLDHLGAVVGQQPGAQRSGPQRGQVDDERPGPPAPRGRQLGPPHRIGFGRRLPQSRHRQPERSRSGHEVGHRVPGRQGGDDGPGVGPVAHGLAEPGRQQRHVLGARERASDPPVGTGDQSGEPAARRGPTARQPRGPRPLHQEVEAVGPHGAAELLDALDQVVGRGERRPLRSARQPHRAGRGPRPPPRRGGPRVHDAVLCWAVQLAPVPRRKDDLRPAHSRVTAPRYPRTVS